MITSQPLKTSSPLKLCIFYPPVCVYWNVRCCQHGYQPPQTHFSWLRHMLVRRTQKCTRGGGVASKLDGCAALHRFSSCWCFRSPRYIRCTHGKYPCAGACSCRRSMFRRDPLCSSSATSNRIEHEEPTSLFESSIISLRCALCFDFGCLKTENAYFCFGSRIGRDFNKQSTIT